MKKQALLELVKKRLLAEIGHRVCAGQPEYDEAARQWRVPILCPAELRREWHGEAITVGTAVLDEKLCFVVFPTRDEVAEALSTAKVGHWPAKESRSGETP